MKARKMFLAFVLSITCALTSIPAMPANVAYASELTEYAAEEDVVELAEVAEDDDDNTGETTGDSSENGNGDTAGNSEKPKGFLGDEDAVNATAGEPESWGATPDANQYRYQKDELAMFVHFGPNTFNEIEWGEHYGDRHPSDIFRLDENFDAKTLVEAAYEAGFKKIIITAKHHDGFCIWPSKWTTYDAEEAGYTGDILAEISEWCTEYDIDMGLYLSPWDIHDASYGYYDADRNPISNATPDEHGTVEGDALDYNDYYNNQLEEILGDDKYGNNGHFVEVWMDGAKGSGANSQEYDFQRWFTTIQQNEGQAAGYEADCMLFGAGAYTTVHWIGNESGLAHSNTWAKIRTDKEAGTVNTNLSNHYAQGFEDGNSWSVPEADARITSGWFWGENKKSPKSVEELANMYFNSVGHNAPLLLNVPPNNQGTVDQPILDRLAEFGRNIKESFDENIAQTEGVKAYASSISGNDVKFKPGNVLDSSDDTYWAPESNQTEGKLIIDLGGEKDFDVVSIEESIKLGQRINSYKIEVFTEGSWQQVDSGTTIGAKRLARFPVVTASKIRITVGTTSTQPFISSVGVFKATSAFEVVSPIPRGFKNIDISDTSIEDGYGFIYDSGWESESGIEFVNGSNIWKNEGSLELKFNGTKVYLLGTVAPQHGTADVSIDGGTPVSINTYKDPRQRGAIIFESETLNLGPHTLSLRGTQSGKAIGIEAAAVLDNGGAGAIELERAAYTVPENTQNEIKLVREGGSTGEVRVRVAANPGSAIQDDFDSDFNQEVVFAEGEIEKTVIVATRRNTNETGDRYFTVELSDVTGGACLGYNDVATVTIQDTESIPPEPSDIYSAENPFVFPANKNETVTLEAERSILTNTGDNEAWPLERKEASWASNGKFVNSLNANDKIEIPYSAQTAGIYKVVATYRSGSGSNKLVWTDTAEKITAGEQSAGNGDANVTKTVEFNITITQAGNGVWTFTGPANGSPQLDKFDITFVKRIGELSEEDPFVFPSTINETVTLEAERSILYNLGNTGQQENGAEKWQLCISDGDWASGGQFVNCLNSGDKIEIPYSVEQVGTYKVVATYRSGSGSNKLVWTDTAGNITAGEQSAGNGDASVTKTVEFDLVVTNAGTGIWTFTGPSGDSPQLDKFEITFAKGKTEFNENDLLGDNAAVNEGLGQPESWGATPDANQYKYHKDELAMFVHFGPNTFNEIEWGEHYGDQHPSEIFRLNEKFDAKTLVEAAYGAGFKKIIITAKHHDGFCIWPSEYTNYDAEEAGYTGDILAEISEWCTEYNIDMGLYLSPWDIHDASYGYYDADRNPISNARPDEHGTVEGDALDYNDYYNNQLEEILGNEKYGNNGHFVEVWMDGAKGSGANSQEYDFQRWFTTIQQNEGKAAGYKADCMLFGAGAYTTVHWIGNESGLAESNTWAKIRTDKEAGTVNTNLYDHYARGFEDGNTWSVPEADARITSGWFWGENKKSPKSVEELANMYFNSVGHNAPLLLNVPPNNKGTIDQNILVRLTEFGRNVQQTFDENLVYAEGVTAYASSISGNDVKFKPGNVLDSSDDTYWAPEADQTEGQLMIDLGEDKIFDVISIEESIKLGQRINSYKVEVYKGGAWEQVDSGTTIGSKRLVRIPAVTASKVRITVGTTSTQPFISSVGVYKASKGFELGNGMPNGMIVVDNMDKDTSDGYGFSYDGWTPETGMQYLNGTNMYKNGGSLTLEFTGTKVYLIGTYAFNHGKAEVAVDGGTPVEIDTRRDERAVKSVIYESESLSPGEHTLTLAGIEADKAIGIEGAVVLNNDGVGLIELESANYTVGEDSQNEFKVLRKGGSTGTVTVRIAANPGTAIQGDFDADFNEEITFEDGETEKTVVIATKRNTNKTGERYFTVELSDTTGGAILGFKDIAKVTIEDTEIKRYTVRFNDEEGNTISEEIVIGGEKVTAPADPVKDGYVFLGWYSGTGKYNFATKVTRDTILTAKWKPIVKYTVTFMDDESTYASREVVKGEQVERPEDPVKEGQKFIGWYKGDRQYNFAAMVMEDITLTAKWKADTTVLEEVILSIENEGLQKDSYENGSWKTFEEVLKAAKEVLKNEKATAEELENAKTALEAARNGLMSILSMPTTDIVPGVVTANTSIQLLSDVEGVSIYYTLDGKEPTEESTLYTEPIALTTTTKIRAIAVKEGYGNSAIAEFRYTVVKEEAVIHVVTFDAANGSTPVEQKVEENNVAKKPADPAKTGYRFLGWFKEDGSRYDFALPVKEDIKLIAKWVVNADELKNLVAECTGISRGRYTEETWTTFKEALNAAQEILQILEDKDATELPTPDGIRAAKDSLKQAVEGLRTGITNGIWIEGLEYIEYTGSKVVPEVTVYDGAKELILGTDYTISFKNNQNVYIYDEEDNGKFSKKKAPTAILKMKGDYTGKKEIYFKINPVSITEENKEIVVNDLYVTYNGKKQTPAPEIFWNGKKLTKKDFYVREYVENSEDFVGSADGKGEVKLTIVGQGNFRGERTIGYTIGAQNIQIAMDKVTVKAEKSKPWNTEDGMEAQITKIEYKGKNGKDVLEEYVDYTIRYENNDAVGTAYIILEGTGEDDDNDDISYYGVKRIPYKITGTSVSKISVKDKQEGYPYTGEEICLLDEGAYLYDNNSKELLTDGAVWVEYVKNVNRGTATMIITGNPQEGWTGVKKESYKITAVELNKDDFVVDFENGETEIAYTSGGATPNVIVTSKDGYDLVAGKDYTLSYKYNKETTKDDTKHQPTITIKGKGNFTKSITEEFTIGKKEVWGDSDVLTVAVKDKVEKMTGKNGWKQSFKIYDTNNKTLSSKDYDSKNVTYQVKEAPKGYEALLGLEKLTDKDQVPAGCVIEVTIPLKGSNYEGIAVGTYRILAEGHDISKATFKIADQVFDGSEITLDEDDFKTKSIKLRKNDKQPYVLTLGEEENADTDFIIVDYDKNINKGNAKVVLRGVNDFGGEKTVTFKIKQRSVVENWWDKFIKFE